MNRIQVIAKIFILLPLSPLPHKIITAIHKHKMAHRHLTPDLDYAKAEPHSFDSIDDILLEPMNAVQMVSPDSSPLGNSKSRTKEQASLAKKIAVEYITKLKNDIVVFTCGSALSNPGPCGSGAAIYWNGIGYAHTLHGAPISPFSTSYHGELGGIELALDSIIDSNYTKPVHILTDCQSALATVTTPKKAKNHTMLKHNVKLKERLQYYISAKYLLTSHG